MKEVTKTDCFLQHNDNQTNGNEDDIVRRCRWHGRLARIYAEDHGHVHVAGKKRPLGIIRCCPSNPKKETQRSRRGNLDVDFLAIHGEISSRPLCASTCPRTSSISVFNSEGTKTTHLSRPFWKPHKKHACTLPTLMAYASDLLAFPFRSVALLLCVQNLAIDDDVSMYVVASPTSRSALVFTMPTRPCCTTPSSCCSKRWCERKGKKSCRREMMGKEKRKCE